MSSLFWPTLTHLGPAAVQVAWRRELGPEYPLASPFLTPTTELATLYPCTHHPPCHCWHEIQPTALATLVAPGTSTEPRPSGSVPAPDAPTLVALCTCGPEECYPIDLHPADALLYALDPGRLAPALRQALNSATPAPLFDPPPAPIPAPRPGTFLLATCGPAKLPVYFHPSPDPLPFLLDLLAAQTPFILATPTETHYEFLLPLQSQHPFLLLPLSQHLALESPAAFRLLTPLHPALEAFQARLAHPTVLAKTLAAIHHELATIHQKTTDLRTENEQLKQMQAQGYFRFALRVDAADFRAFAAIMALGRRYVAADFLQIPRSSLYLRVQSWAAKGGDYTRMFRLVEWRATQGRKVKVRLEDSLLSGEPGDGAENPQTIRDVLTRMQESAADARNYPDLLREILDLLNRQDPRNWKAIQSEALDILKSEVLE